jgi:hypothetical protein
MVALLKMPMRIGAKDAQNAQGAQGAERRIFPRKEVHAAVEGVRVDHSIEARRTPKFNLNLRDLSYGGMSAISPLPLLCGERLSMIFPPLGLNSGWDASGRVLRCEPSAMGYRIAVEFELQAAA